MARPLKPHEVEKVVDPHTHELSIIYFDRDRKDFFAKVGTEEYRKPDVNTLRLEVRKALAEFKPYEWKSYIFIDGVMDRSSRWGGTYSEQFRVRVDFAFWRKEVATKKNGTILLRPVLDEKNLADDDLIEEEQAIRHEEWFEKNRAQFYARKAEVNLSRRRDMSDLESYNGKVEDITEVVMPFSEPVWMALHAIRQRLLTAESQLDQIVKHPEIQKKLVEVAKSLKLLPASPKGA